MEKKRKERIYSCRFSRRLMNIRRFISNLFLLWQIFYHRLELEQRKLDSFRLIKTLNSLLVTHQLEYDRFTFLPCTIMVDHWNLLLNNGSMIVPFIGRCSDKSLDEIQQIRINDEKHNSWHDRLLIKSVLVDDTKFFLLIDPNQRLSQGALFYCQSRTEPAEFMWQNCPVTVSDPNELVHTRWKNINSLRRFRRDTKCSRSIFTTKVVVE